MTDTPVQKVYGAYKDGRPWAVLRGDDALHAVNLRALGTRMTFRVLDASVRKMADIPPHDPAACFTVPEVGPPNLPPSLPA